MRFTPDFTSIDLHSDRLGEPFFFLSSPHKLQGAGLLYLDRLISVLVCTIFIPTSKSTRGQVITT